MLPKLVPIPLPTSVDRKTVVKSIKPRGLKSASPILNDNGDVAIADCVAVLALALRFEAFLEELDDSVAVVAKLFALVAFVVLLVEFFEWAAVEPFASSDAFEAPLSPVPANAVIADRSATTNSVASLLLILFPLVDSQFNSLFRSLQVFLYREREVCGGTVTAR